MIYNEVRPHRFDEVVGQTAVVKAIKNQIKSGSLMGTSIFEGQYGTGKTTLARIAALALNCKNPDEEGNPCLCCECCKAILSGHSQDYMELDAASNSGVENVRQIIEDVSYMPMFLKKKIYILDEVHMLSKAAWNSLLKTLEEPPEYAVFMLCTTDVKAVPATILSRSARYSFLPLRSEEILSHLQEISERKHILSDRKGLELITSNSDGSLRNALSLLEQASVLGSATSEQVMEMLGVADNGDVFSVLENILAGNAATVAASIRRFSKDGKDLKNVFDEMIHILSDAIVVLSSGKDAGEVLFGVTDVYACAMESFTGKLSLEKCVNLSGQLMDIMFEIKQQHPGTDYVVMRMVQICGKAQTTDIDITLLLERIAFLEKEVKNLKAYRASVGIAETSTDAALSEDTHREVKQEDTADTSIVHADDNETILHEEKEEEEELLVDTSSTSTENPSKAEEKAAEIPDNLLFSLFGGIVPEAQLEGKKAAVAHGQAYMEASDDADDYLEENKENDSDCVAMEMPPSVEFSKDVQSIFKTIGDVAEQDAAFSIAIYEGCIYEVVKGRVIFYTPLKPLEQFLQSYFEAYEISAKVIFDAKVNLSEK